jgi:ActR/RegA family two-component response regulator
MIMLTGRGSRSVDLEAMRAGAADYLVEGSIAPDVGIRRIPIPFGPRAGNAA